MTLALIQADLPPLPEPVVPPHLIPPPAAAKPPHGYPLTSWAAEGEEWYVPPESRGFYAQPVPPVLEATFWRSEGMLVVAATFDHDAAIERAESAGRLRDGLLRAPSQLIVEPDDTIQQYGTKEEPLYRVTEHRRLSTHDAFPMWLHSTRLARAADMQANLDRALIKFVQRCQICGGRNPDRTVDGLWACKRCDDTIAQLGIAYEPIVDDYSRRDYVLRHLDEHRPQLAAAIRHSGGA